MPWFCTRCIRGDSGWSFRSEQTARSSNQSWSVQAGGGLSLRNSGQAATRFFFVEGAYWYSVLCPPSTIYGSGREGHCFLRKVNTGWATRGERARTLHFAAESLKWKGAKSMHSAKTQKVASIVPFFVYFDWFSWLIRERPENISRKNSKIVTPAVVSRYFSFRLRCKRDGASRESLALSRSPAFPSLDGFSGRSLSGKPNFSYASRVVNYSLTSVDSLNSASPS